ncbi:MAG: hypothetical protein KAJ40_05570 [Alphaproteobacteria bacterium]|nr:hypothetical protein [Alphaproteobacteria bacterium]
MIASIIVFLYLTGAIDANSAIASLYITGALLIIAEIGVVSFGLIALNGIIALYAAYAIQSGNDLIFGLPIGWHLLFGMVFVELSTVFCIIAVHLHLRKQKVVSGTESMINDNATIIEWDGQKGSVRYDGEIWKAMSEEPLTVKPDDKVTIKAVNKLELVITQ